MHASATKQAKVFSLLRKLFSCVKSKKNKDWERLVPAAAVIPAVQVATRFIGPKAFVAGQESSL